MATIVEALVQQSTREIRRWTADFTDDLPTGGSITAGTCIHTPPSGTAFIGTTTFTDTTVTSMLGPLAVTGIHYVDIQATFSNGEKSEVRVEFPVNYPTETARASMADLVAILRGLTNTGAVDYKVGGLPYWSDKQLQTVLDRHMQTVRHEALTPIDQVGSATVNYYDYQSSRRFFESTSAGTARFIIQDQTGGTVGTAAWTADYPSGLVTFGTDTGGQVRYLTGFSYDMNAAAADVWAQKASHYAEAYDFATDNHSLKRSQLIDQCLRMSKEYAAGAAIQMVSVDRSDMGGGYDDPTIRSGRTHN